MAPGEVVRFRVLNACSDNLMPIVVEGHEMHLIALDGVNFPAPRTMPVYTEYQRRWSGVAGAGQSRGIPDPGRSTRPLCHS